MSLIPFVITSGCSKMRSHNDSAQLGTYSRNRYSTLPLNDKFNPFSEDKGTDIKRRHVIENPTIAQIMQPGPLPEMSLGRSDAPVKIIKYASMTCAYCRQFQIETFPILEQEYITTGKVLYILREFPIGFQSGAATIALRCAKPNKYFALYDKFMKQQSTWVSRQVRREPIFQIVSQVGVTRDEFDACFEDKILSYNLNQIKERGRTLGIIGTPNYFINGRLYKRRLTIRDIRELVNKALADSDSTVR
ncbi:MAG: DsbA family protein [Hyphomicrobiaceae bacterium]|nr:DsbA family protein [Hyphomicrobiaceae bacterium]